MRTTLAFILLLLITWSTRAQSPTKLIYTQQSSLPASDQLKTADLTGTLPTTGVTLVNDVANFNQPTDVVFDPVNNFIYLVDATISTGPILRFSYNPATNVVSNRTVIVAGTASATYQGLALDIANNRLYFTQSSITNSLDALKVVSGISGSTFTVTQLTDGLPANGNFTNPNDLIFDPVNNYLYLVDQFVITGPILRFNTTGTAVSNRTVVVAASGIANTTYGGLALDIVANKLYFTQYNTGTPASGNALDALKQVTLSGTPPYTPTTLVDGSTAAFVQPTDLVLDRVNNYLYVADQTIGGSIYRYTTAGTGQTQITGPASASSSYGGVTLNAGFFTPVTLTSSTPADNATNVSATADIVLTFDRAVSKGSGNFEIRRTSDNALIETISVISGQVTGSGTTWTINPAVTLAAGTSYALRAASGVFKAADGGSYAGINDNTTLNFATNAIPTDITLSNSSVAENQPINTLVGSISTTDADAGQTFSYSLVTGAGSDDNASFKLVGNQLQTNAVFNFETKSSYFIRLRTTDNGIPALSFEKSFTITVTNVNELTVSISAQTNVSCNGGANGAATATVSGELAPFTYNWRNTTTNTTLGQTGSAVTGLTAGAYSLTVTATSSGFTATTSFAISQPAALTISVAQTKVSTAGGSDGTASVSVSGGTSGYSYDWTPGSPTGDGTASVSSLSAGAYGITVTDANGCTASASFIISTASDLTPILSARPSLAYGTSTISVVVSVVEVNSTASTGPITVKIPKDGLVDLTFPASATMVNGRSVQNSAWSFSGPSGGFYTLTTTNVVAGGDVLSFGLNGTLTPGGTTGSLSVSAILVGGSGGELRVDNNNNADKIEYFPQ